MEWAVNAFGDTIKQYGREHGFCKLEKLAVYESLANSLSSFNFGKKATIAIC